MELTISRKAIDLSTQLCFRYIPHSNQIRVFFRDTNGDKGCYGEIILSKMEVEELNDYLTIFMEAQE